MWLLPARENLKEDEVNYTMPADEVFLKNFREVINEKIANGELDATIRNRVKSEVAEIFDENANLLRKLYDTDPEFKERVDQYLKLPAAAPSA